MDHNNIKTICEEDIARNILENKGYDTKDIDNSDILKLFKNFYNIDHNLKTSINNIGKNIFVTNLIKKKVDNIVKKRTVKYEISDNIVSVYKNELVIQCTNDDEQLDDEYKNFMYFEFEELFENEIYGVPSVLIRLSNLNYVIISKNIIGFTTPELITSYIGYMGNNADIHPWANSENFTYTLINTSCGNEESYMINYKRCHNM